MKMPPPWHALPHQYGAKVRIRDVEAFARSYGIQAQGADSFVIVPPSHRTLAEWAKSCLGLANYRGMHSCGGWSPFRSVEVGVRRAGEEDVEHYYYALGDNNRYDFVCNTPPADYPLHSWMETLSAFARIALSEYVRDPKQDRMISPRAAVMKMLYVEWGSAGDSFTILLSRAGVEPKNLFEAMVGQAWGGIVSLPRPDALCFLPQDGPAQDMMIALAARAKEKKQCSGLRG